MNIWIRLACLAVVFCIYMACSTTHKSKRKQDEHGAIHKIDSLPMTIIPSEIIIPDSIVRIDTTSGIWMHRHNVKSLINQSMLSEKLKIKSDHAVLLKNEVLTHISLTVLKLSIDDYRNINYLNQDF